MSSLLGTHWAISQRGSWDLFPDATPFLACLGLMRLTWSGRDKEFEVGWCGVAERLKGLHEEADPGVEFGGKTKMHVFAESCLAAVSCTIRC